MKNREYKREEDETGLDSECSRKPLKDCDLGSNTTVPEHQED